MEKVPGITLRPRELQFWPPLVASVRASGLPGPEAQPGTARAAAPAGGHHHQPGPPRQPGRRSRPVSRDQAMRALTEGVDPCALCRPDTELGISLSPSTSLGSSARS
ncbi:DUF6233 domain-containing protein [Streptomyces halobius]|uniref:DUF6233 domain-containing protein n=2 Tax=Streptomyces halobius TaxID=2879846 RepID=A0ABY4MIE2_9ACTN|nr:DUF6233 domain-containing protein [Streptomyces halobius]